MWGIVRRNAVRSGGVRGPYSEVWKLPEAIETQKLTKVYEGGFFSGQEVHALKNVDLTVHPGEIYAYLGPNGSGKTTTIKMMLGLIFPTSGTIKIFDRTDLTSPEVRRRIGYLPEGAYYPDFLQGDEILRFYGKLYGLRGRDLEKRIDNVLDVVKMTHARKRLLRGYSKGMRQRIGLAQALLSDPDLLILDEPTTGLDPLARREIRDILAGLRDEGKTLMISSHELMEVELISNRVSILYRGVMQTTGTLDELLQDREIAIEVESIPDAAKSAVEGAGARIEPAPNGRPAVHIPASMSMYDGIDLCKQANLNIISVAPRRETLEELFIRTVGAAEDKEREIALAQQA